MRIACPACNAVYEVPDEQLRDGRVVRCARCGTDWAPNVALPEPESELAPEPGLEHGGESLVVEPEPEPPRQMALEEEVPAVVVPPRPTLEEPVRRGGPALAIAWVVSVLAVGGMIALLVVERGPIMRAWPPAIRAYAALGLSSEALPPGEGAGKSGS